MWRKKELLYAVVRMYIDQTTMENSIEIPKKTNKTIISLSNSTTGYISK